MRILEMVYCGKHTTIPEIAYMLGIIERGEEKNIQKQKNKIYWPEGENKGQLWDYIAFGFFWMKRGTGWIRCIFPRCLKNTRLTLGDSTGFMARRWKSLGYIR